MRPGKYRRLWFHRPHPWDFRELAFVYGIVWISGVIGAAIFGLIMGPHAGTLSEDYFFALTATVLGWTAGTLLLLAITRVVILVHDRKKESSSDR